MKLLLVMRHLPKMAGLFKRPWMLIGLALAGLFLWALVASFGWSLAAKDLQIAAQDIARLQGREALLGEENRILKTQYQITEEAWHGYCSNLMHGGSDQRPIFERVLELIDDANPDAADPRGGASSAAKPFPY